MERKYITIDDTFKPVTTRIFSSRYPDDSRDSMLGIGAHFKQSIERGSLDINNLWLANYLNSSPTESEDEGARVTVYIRVVQRTETIEQQFIDKNMCEYGLKSCGRATHLIEQVNFGAEFICCLRRNVDLTVETKTDAEDQIYWAAKIYFDHAVKTNWTEMEPPLELDNISCVLYNSLGLGQVLQRLQHPFRQSVDWLQKVLLYTNNKNNWRPVKITLRPIPEQLETLRQSERIVAKKLKMELNWCWIKEESRLLTKHPTLHRIPPFEKILTHFVNLLESLRCKIEQLHAFGKLDAANLKQIPTVQEPVKSLLLRVIDWVVCLRQEIEAFHLFLNGSHLAVLDMSEIESRPLTVSPSRADVFILHVDYKQDPVMEEIQTLLGYPSPDVKRPFFPITTAEKKRLDAVGDALRGFSKEARLNSNANHSYQIGLVPVFPAITEGSVKSISLPAMPSSVPRNVSRSPPPLMPI